MQLGEFASSCHCNLGIYGNLWEGKRMDSLCVAPSRYLRSSWNVYVLSYKNYNNSQSVFVYQKTISLRDKVSCWKWALLELVVPKREELQCTLPLDLTSHSCRCHDVLLSDIGDEWDKEKEGGVRHFSKHSVHSAPWSLNSLHFYSAQLDVFPVS